MELDKKCVEALALLYQSENGQPFDALNIDNSTFLLLRKHDYLSEPEGEFFETGAGMMCVHKGNVKIEPLGRAYVENTRTRQTREKTVNRRYWITTGIAALALVKSFLPEILAGWALLLKLLTPQ